MATVIEMNELSTDKQGEKDGNKVIAQQPLLDNSKDITEYAKLKEIFKCGTPDQIKNLLTEIDPNIDLHKSRPLHWAAEGGNVHAVNALLRDKRTDINVVTKYCRTALHIAAMNGNHEVLKLLLQEAKDIDINAVEKQGRTALHLAAETPVSGDGTDGRYLRCLEFLLARSDIEVNKPDRHGRSPISRALRKSHKMRVQVILKHKDAHKVNVDYSLADGGQTIRESILEKYPEFEALVPEPLMEDTNSPQVQLCLLATLQRGLFDEFKDVLDNNKDLIKIKYEEPYHCTCLEMACVIRGREEFAKVILDLTPDPNIENHVSGIPLLYTTAERLNIPALEVLLKTEDIDINITGMNGGSVLHWLALNTCGGNESFPILEKCVSMLKKSTDIDAKDNRKETPLHVAVRWKNMNFALVMLISGAKVDMWNRNKHTPLHVAALTGNNDAVLTLKKFGAKIDSQDGEGTPLYVAARMGKKDTVLLLLRQGADFMCEVKGEAILQYLDMQIFREFLDGFIESKGNNVKSPQFMLAFKYNFLPSVKDTSYISHTDTEMHHILKISETTELRGLLKHPVISSVLFIKWHHVRRLVYFNILLYSLFLLFLTFHVVFIRNSPKEHEKQLLNESVHSESTADSSPASSSIMSEVATALLVSFLILILVKELVQLIADRTEYFSNLGNLFDASVIACTFIYLLVSHCDINRHAAAIGILLAWIDLLLLIGHLPNVSVQLSMLKKVSKTFIKFGLCYIPIIVAFGLSFNVLFRKENSVITDGTWNKVKKIFIIIFETLIMFTGEFDTKGLSFNSVPVTSHLIFLFFVLLVALTLLNLLNGLAVSDTRAITEDAEIISLVTRVKLIFKTEKIILLCQRNRFFKKIIQKYCFFLGDLPSKRLYVYPNENYKYCYVPGSERMGHMDSAITKSAISIAERNISQS
ncbi:transient receptor potential channel pyrexia-like isoform X2 [Zootermopsis nevadensis]|uniref:transient receptor potential channel pyrexia-like isoform X2 n=1 Tax=Zootermopsis nevadensis TaxID=136037 RepID=UPI000B8E99C4|nr:transient receptor potential channel pyrexia-like isoform X2 [Zootermopsis nevadensis]